MRVNTNFHQLENNYLFTDVLNKKQAYLQSNPQARLLNLGIGDVTLPLPAASIEAMHRAVDELSHKETFRGYGLEQGSTFLRQAVIQNDYRPLGIELDMDEVFISDGAGSDLGNTSELFATNNRVAVQDPVYPAYVDTNVMAGREITYMPCLAENGFVPSLPAEHVDLIYLCSPNNPTGTALTRQQLQRFVDYAIREHSIIIFDSAYEVFVEEPDVPHSIYEIEGAKQVAIEIRSYSKTAGFTGVRCGYTVVPKQTGLHQMWYRRQCTKYNGTSYISQRGAEAIYSAEGRAQVMDNIHYYKHTAQILTDGLRSLGYEVYGGKNAPYIWCRTPDGMGSWQFFDYLLEQCQVVCVPGVGFGRSGEGFVRFSAFSDRDECKEAIERINRK